MKVLDVGCGNKKIPGAIGIDFQEGLQADVVHDLNCFPYPFDDSEFDEVNIISTLFLLNDPVKTMEEVYRLCKTGGSVVVLQPYFRSPWNYVDPWVKNFGTVHSFAFYDPDDPICTRYKYSHARFKLERLIFNEKLEKSYYKRLLCQLAERYPRHYELYISHLFPLDTITYHLRRV
jgi:ubiquinone/menaquinone biosynthesis C-methylase UbiE